MDTNKLLEDLAQTVNTFVSSAQTSLKNRKANPPVDFKAYPKSFWIPRLSALALSFLVIAFLTDLSLPGKGGQKTIATLVGILATAAIGFYIKKEKRLELIVFLPLGFWFALFIYYIIGGMDADIGFIRYLFLSILTLIPIVLSFISWIQPRIGGVIYAFIGIFYMFLAVGHESFLVIIAITGFFLQTGTLFFVQDKLTNQPTSESQPITKILNQQTDEGPKENTQPENTTETQPDKEHGEQTN